MSTRFVAALVIVVGAAACGGSPSGGSPTAPTPVAPTIVASGDNWSLRLDGFIGAPARTITPSGMLLQHTYGSTAPLVALEGALNVSAGSVSAVLQPFGRCFDWDVNRLRFTGTRSGDIIQLEAQPNQGQVVRLTLQVSADGSAAQGTYTITGGCGGGTSGPVDGRRVNFTGVWTGMMGAISTVFDMQMAIAPDIDGNFNISGTARFSDTSCFPSATITRRGRGRIIFPDVVSEPHHMELIAEVWEDLSTIQISFALVRGTCPELAAGKGRLVRQ